MLEEIPTLVWRAGPEGNIEYVNKHVLDYFGAPLGEVVGWAWMVKVHPDDVAFKVRTWLQKSRIGKTSRCHLYARFRGAGGRISVVRGPRKTIASQRFGAVLGWYGVLIDIDDRRRAEEALRESEYKHRQIIETVPSLQGRESYGEQTDISRFGKRNFCG